MDYRKFKLSIVIPVYNSQQTIGRLVDELIENLKDYNFEIILVNDYSKDNSHEICVQKCEKYPGIIRYMRLSRNFGEHNAVMAGLNHVVGDYAIIMDDDFQNPPEDVVKMISYMLKNKFDVLYTYYEEKKHGWFRNIGSLFNDRVATLLLNKPNDLYLSSFKCINRFLINEIKKYCGPYPYIDGLILRVTQNIGKVKVGHEERTNGRSNYTLRKLIALWMNMFINFSIVPIRISFFLGLALTSFGFMLVFYFFVDMYILNPEGEWPPGWASLLVCIITFSGAQLMSLGLIGEYIGKLFLTDNGTPQFIVSEYYEKDEMQ
jgi:glycosyltransferase involved in cell wall biosynthesis